MEVIEDPWFILTSKFKVLKQALKGLNHKVGNLHSLAKNTREALLNFQNQMPPSPSLEQFSEEKGLIEAYMNALNLEENFLKRVGLIG